MEGELNFPDVTMDHNVLNFGCLPPYISAYETFLLTNISPLPVLFKWEWVPENFYCITNEEQIVRNIS